MQQRHRKTKALQGWRSRSELKHLCSQLRSRVFTKELLRSVKKLHESTSDVSIDGVLEMLANIPLFSRLKKQELLLLCQAAAVVRFAVGKTVVKQGEQGSTFYLILRGETDVLVQKPGESEASTVGQIKEGGYFGERALLTKVWVAYQHC